MEDTIKTERSMEQENKLDVKLPTGAENFIEQLAKTNIDQLQQQLQQQQQQHKWETSAIRHDNDNNSATTATTTTTTNAQQNRQLQQADMPQMQNYNNNNENKNAHYAAKRATLTSVHNFNVQQQQFQTAAGTRCGEIFVSHNTRKWTFVCTYCNKSTRDIGAFILHLNKMHLSGICNEEDITASDDDDDGDDDDALSLVAGEHIDERACNTSGQEQDVRNNRQMQQAIQYTYAGT